MTGLFSAWMMLPRTNDTKCQRNLQIMGTILLFAWFVTFICILATKDPIEQHWYYNQTVAVEAEDSNAEMTLTNIEIMPAESSRDGGN